MTPVSATAMPAETIEQIAKGVRAWRAGILVWRARVTTDVNPIARRAALRQIAAWETELAATERRLIQEGQAG